MFLIDFKNPLKNHKKIPVKIIDILKSTISIKL